VSEGSLDAAVAALTVTGPRHRVVDFTQPFYSTGLGIAVASETDINWWSIIRNVFSLGFFRAAAVLFTASLSVGVILWLIEHRHNEHFGADRQGLGASIWWAAAAMTQIGGAAAGGKVPRTLPGRLIAIVWMVTSVIIFVSLTAALTSQLTLKHLRGPVNGQADLQYVRVARSLVLRRPNILTTNTSPFRLLPTRSRVCRHCRGVKLMHWYMTGRCFCGLSTSAFPARSAY
jgi:polar amino acid transport system substrate-binding protein